MKRFIEQNQISVFFVLTLLFSWFPWYAGIAPETMNLGPSLAAFVVVLIIGGKAGLLDWLRPFGRFRVGLAWWGIALFGPAILYLLGLGIYLLMGGSAPQFTMLREELNLLPLYFVMVVLLPWNGPVGEEFGWRGFALPKLQRRYGPLVASLILGGVWGVWHLPSFFAPQGVLGTIVATLGMVFLIPYVLGTVANTIIMTWLYNRTGSSALIAGIAWHAAINFWAPRAPE